MVVLNVIISRQDIWTFDLIRPSFCLLSDKKFDIDPETKGLVIRHVSRQDEGKYRCKATQVNTQDSDLKVTDIELKVLCEYIVT